MECSELEEEFIRHHSLMTTAIPFFSLDVDASPNCSSSKNTRSCSTAVHNSSSHPFKPDIGLLEAETRLDINCESAYGAHVNVPSHFNK